MMRDMAWSSSSCAGRAGDQGHVQPSSGDLAAARERRPAQSPAGQWSLEHSLCMGFLYQQVAVWLGRTPHQKAMMQLNPLHCAKAHLLCCMNSWTAAKLAPA